MGSLDDAEDEDSLDVGAYLVEKEDVEILNCIGEGSTSMVYKANVRSKDGVKVVAVKEILGLHEDSLTAFQRELCVLVKVQHPHIVSFLGLVSESDPLRLCLEFCAGGSLFHLLYNTSTKLSWRQRIVMLYDTATAVAHLHSFSPKVVHRDLKSLNVLFLKQIVSEHDEPHVKLCDFGFARENEASMTQGAGTSHWMAPEVISGTVYTEKADSFSFAMIVYEVVCRRVPFIDCPAAQVPRLIMSGVRPGKDTLNLVVEDGESGNVVPAEVPPGLTDLIRRCWHQQPDLRPTFTEIWQILADVSSKTPDLLKLATPGVLYDAETYEEDSR